MFNPGEYRHKIKIQNFTSTRDSFGGETEDWADFKSPWASVVTTGGGEFYAAQKVNAETSVLFKIRYSGGIDEKMRIVYRGKIYEILHINNVDGRDVELKISAKVVE